MGLALMGALRAIELGNLMEPKGSRLLPQRSTTPLVYSVSTLDRVCCCRKELKVRSPVKRKRESFVQLLGLYSYLHDSEGGVEIPREFPA